MLGLRFCARAFSSCGERGPLFTAVCGPLTIAASPVAEHKLQTRRLSSCVSWAQLLRGMWDLPRPGLKPVSPALAGRFSTTAPPGKPLLVSWMYFLAGFLLLYETQLLIPWSPRSISAGLIPGALFLVCGILFFMGIWSVQICYGLEQRWFPPEVTRTCCC